MFQFPSFPSLRLYIQRRIPAHYDRWVPPFGYLRINGYLLLPAAFRSLSRPSSAPSAKASALCSSLLDLLLVFSAPGFVAHLRALPVSENPSQFSSVTCGARMYLSLKNSSGFSRF